MQPAGVTLTRDLPQEVGIGVLWAVAANADADDIAVDGAGNSYVAGSFNVAATFGATALSPKGGYDVFVWKVVGK